MLRTQVSILIGITELTGPLKMFPTIPSSVAITGQDKRLSVSQSLELSVTLLLLRKMRLSLSLTATPQVMSSSGHLTGVTIMILKRELQELLLFSKILLTMLLSQKV